MFGPEKEKATGRVCTLPMAEPKIDPPSDRVANDDPANNDGKDNGRKHEDNPSVLLVA